MSKSEQTCVSFRGDDRQKLIVTLVNPGADCPTLDLLPKNNLGSRCWRQTAKDTVFFLPQALHGLSFDDSPQSPVTLNRASAFWV
jgi:hypothetical protein